MTVSTSQIRVTYNGDGSTVNFPIPFPFYLSTDLLVLLNTATLSSGYSVSGGNGSTGTLTMAVAPTASPLQVLQIILNVPLTQLVNLVDGTAFPSATINQVNDRSIQAALRLQDQISRSLRAPDGDVSPGLLLPAAASRAGLFLGFDGSGNILVTSAGAGTANTQQTLGPILNPQTAAEISAGVTPTNYVYQPGDVRRYGADPTGAGDSTAAFRAAGSIGMLITVPKGTYKVSAAAGTINITGGGMKGDGAYQSTIASTDTSTNDTFTYTGALAGVFQDIQFSPSATKGAGAFQLTIGPASGEVSGMRILQCVFNNSANHLYFKRASLWSMMACNFYAFSGTAVLVDNQNDGDSGDSAILGCQFTSPGNSGSYAIRQVSSGGLKITTTKFNNVGVGYLLDLGTVAGHVSTSITLIDNCSFETATFSAVQLQRQVGSTATFANFSISNCEFLVQGASAAAIFSNDSSGFLSNVNIGPNVFQVNGTSGASAIQLDYVQNFSIAPQTINGPNSGSQFGILIGTHNTGKLKISRQSINNCSTSISVPSGFSLDKSDIQTGSVNVTTSSADGSFFSGTATVTFPTAFDSSVALTVGDASVQLAGVTNGGISCAVTAITSTTMTVLAIGFTNGGSVAVNWRVAGLI